MSGKGSREWEKYRNGEELTKSQSIKAMCASCCADYIDGRESCEIEACPLFPFHPYNLNGRKSTRKGNPNPTWLHKGTKEPSQDEEESDEGDEED